MGGELVLDFLIGRKSEVSLAPQRCEYLVLHRVKQPKSFFSRLYLIGDCMMPVLVSTREVQWTVSKGLVLSVPVGRF